jgi:hypothetical protein
MHFSLPATATGGAGSLSTYVTRPCIRLSRPQILRKSPKGVPHLPLPGASDLEARVVLSSIADELADWLSSAVTR